MKDLYKILGVPKDASTHAIRAAYKLRARTEHPDKSGGSTEAFQALNEAYSILRDPNKRKRYDAGESVKDIPTARRIAMAQLSELFAQAIDHARDDRDLIEAVRKSVNTSFQQIENTNTGINKKIEQYEKVLSRVHYSGAGDDDVFTGTVNSKLSQLRNTLKQNENNLEAGKIIIELLNNYECDVEASTSQPFSGFATATSTTGWRQM